MVEVQKGLVFLGKRGRADVVVTLKHILPTVPPVGNTSTCLPHSSEVPGSGKSVCESRRYTDRLANHVYRDSLKSPGKTDDSQYRNIKNKNRTRSS